MPYMLNGDMLDVATEPKVMDGTMFVPLRKLAVALGGSADWEPSNGVAILYLGDEVATFDHNSKTVDVTGQQSELQASPLLEDGEVWVPVRFFENQMGYQLDADSQNGIVSLTKV